MSFGPGTNCSLAPVGCTEVFPYLGWIETYVDGLHFYVDDDGSSTPDPTTTTTTPPNNDDSEICGKKANSNNRIIGGETADNKEWPWQVALLVTGKLWYYSTITTHLWYTLHCECNELQLLLLCQKRNELQPSLLF